MNLFHVYDIILPALGSLKYGYGDDLTIPTFELNSSYGYQVYFFDPKFQMPFRNPLIVPRTSFKILANLTYFEVNIKVYTCIFLDETKTKTLTFNLGYPS